MSQLTKIKSLDFFVLYSSMSVQMPAPGQGAYAAANSCLDTLAHYHKSMGLCALAMNWGIWGEVGMMTKVGSDHGMRKGGLGVISVQKGLEVLGRGIVGGRSQSDSFTDDLVFI